MGLFVLVTDLPDHKEKRRYRMEPSLKTNEELNKFSYQLTFKRTCSERVRKAIKRALRPPEICLDRSHAEINAYEKYKNEPRVIQRARVFQTYLRDKKIYISDGELIVGNVTSKLRGSPVFAELTAKWISEELDDPEKDLAIRKYDKHIIHPEERKELREVILPYWKGKTLEDLCLANTDHETIEKTHPFSSRCPHISQMADRMSQQDAGKQMTNYEKVLHIGLSGIKKEIQWYLDRLDQPYNHFDVKKKRDFYKACLIAIDGAIAYADRYSALAKEMAAKENDPVRKAELERIAEVCNRVPAEPARNWWEALQSVWFIHVFIHCEFLNVVNSFGLFDQYMYPFYKQSVIDDKQISRNEALELMECFLVKSAEHTALMSWAICMYQAGYSTVQCLMIGGQTQDGKDATNEVSWLVLDAEEQVGLFQPDIAVRVWEGTPSDFLKRAAEVVRLGRGKPKFFFDRKIIQMAHKTWPGKTMEDYRGYAINGCIELNLPGVNMNHTFVGLTNASKILELVMNNGKCSLCGEQIGPTTGDPHTFETMAAVKEAFRKQMFYWMEYVAKAVKVQMDIQAERMQSPFCSSLMDGPLQKGIDLIEGGAWDTAYGIYEAAFADCADALGVIDMLVYRQKKVTWDELLTACNANWEGYDNLRQLCINKVPKYGNDIDYADDWAVFVMDTYQDIVDWINTQRQLLPKYGGQYVSGVLSANGPVGLGETVGSLPNGHICPRPLADTMSPSQGMDKKGPTAVAKSAAKMPLHRFTLGAALNQRLDPQLLETDRNLENFVSYLRTCEELGMYNLQINVISAELLRKAIKNPDGYRDVMVRVASYCSYFVELDPSTQRDIIARSEQASWSGC